MGVCIGALEQRQMERLRGEIAETLAANFAYPPFFDFRLNRMRVRPIDRAKRGEIEQFVHSFNFDALKQVDVTSPDVRRFIERLFLRYIEVNAAFARPRYERLRASMRSATSRAAAHVQRNLTAHLEGSAPAFGARQQQPSWAGTPQKTQLDTDDVEHNTRVLQATLLRRASDVPGPYVPVTPAPRTAPPQQAQQARPAPAPVPAQANWSMSTADATVPVTAMYPPSAPAPIHDAPTGPLAAVHPAPSPARQASAPSQTHYSQGGQGSSIRDLPEDLYQLYGEYLRDMQPEASVASEYLPTQHAPAAPMYNGYQAPVSPGMQGISQIHVPTVQQSGVLSEEVRSDKLIFWQLRYQLEAYVRRAARSYGIQTQSGEPYGVLDALRRSGFVDEADLRIAEGILALTDKVTASSSASLDDYRQALMLYLLYHRSHLGS